MTYIITYMIIITYMMYIFIYIFTLKLPSNKDCISTAIISNNL